MYHQGSTTLVHHVNGAVGELKKEQLGFASLCIRIKKKKKIKPNLWEHCNGKQSKQEHCQVVQK